MEIIIRYAIVAIFGLSVLGKLTGKTKSTFDNAGYSPAIMYLTGLAEILLTALLFTKFSFYAIVGLLVIIAGAIFTLFRQNAKPAKYILAIIALILLVALLILSIKA